MDWAEGINIKRPYEVYKKMTLKRAGPKSLQELMLTYVSLNIESYCTMARKTGTNPLNVIQPVMKRRLLAMEGMKHGVKRRLGTRLSNHVSYASQLLLERDATWFSSTVVESSDHLLNALTVQCPHLQSLSLRLTNRHCVDREGNARTLSSLLVFSQLQLLHVPELQCNDEDLIKIAQGLPNLRTLRIGLAKTPKTVSEVGVAALSKLQHLHEFSFSCYDKVEKARVLRLSLQLMPQLRVAGERFTHRYLRLLLQHGGWRPQPRIVWDNQDVLVRMLCKELLAVPRPNQLGLEQVALVGASRLPDHLALPNLESLVLLEPRVDILQPDERLSRVSELVLLDASMDNVVTPLLSQMGQQLRSLSLRVCMASLDIVLRTCPNLTELNLNVNKLLTGFDHPDEQLQMPQQLQVLRIVGADYKKQHLKTGLLPRLLKAPLLSRVRLDTIALAQKDTEDIIQLLADRAILQHLKKFSLKGSGHYDPLRDVNHREFLASAIVVHCPLIEAFDVHIL